MRLELPQNPGSTFARRPASTRAACSSSRSAIRRACPWRALRSRSSMSMRTGRMRDVRRDFNGTLAAGQQVQVATGLGPFQSADQFKVAIASARIAEIIMTCAAPGGWSRRGGRSGKRERLAQRQDEFAILDRNAVPGLRSMRTTFWMPSSS